MKQPSDQDFRDHIATVDESGKRTWIYPSKPKGSYHRARAWVAVALLAFLIITPFIKVNGHPYFLLNIVERRFILFGEPFWPQDFKILVLVFITLILFIILFTTIWGRLWCGWACPQTIFMEMVFRKIEFWFEGDGVAQKKLNQAPWTTAKVLKKVGKQAVFILMSYAVSHIFLSWIIGVDELWKIIHEPIREHYKGFIGLNFFTLMFYFVFSWFREQACVIVCPYGRFQSVLLDKNTTVISYDYKRGEPRGKKKQAEGAAPLGDCVDCKQCVRVCPTGIDIRHGTQLECVNCTACMDSCDHIMDKLNRPKGLIRYASHAEIEQGFQKLLTVRTVAYSIVLAALLSLSTYLLFSRPMSHITVTRVRGSVYQTLEDGSVLNLFRIKFANNTFEDHRLTLKLKEPMGALRSLPDMVLPSYGSHEALINVLMPKEGLSSRKMFLNLDVLNENGQVIGSEVLTFIGPQLRKS